ncbi:MAG: TIGR01212 family radical SAM protein [Erysipelotrichaceae bacterium]|nr:TIGR01212 family radical SAM protein [Erysipelotrichaceae bacterium]
MNNPFPYSLDNKRYHTWNYYLKTHYGTKVCKVPLNAGFTCPNRDGSKSTGGCTFCSSLGSGEFQGASKASLMEQFEHGAQIMHRKWPDAQLMAYFQSYTNTYGPLEKIKECVEPFLEREDVIGICIATRSDCLPSEVIDYLNKCADIKDIWIELGLQTIHDCTSERINRAHTYEQFKEKVLELTNTKLKICVHLMNSLPYETEEMMLQTAKEVGKLPIHALKIHMLHLIKGTKMHQQYQEEPFDLLTQEQYVQLVVKQLRLIPPHIIIQRLTGDGMKDSLAAPLWTLNKTQVTNDIDKLMAKLNVMQGDLYE